MGSRRKRATFQDWKHCPWRRCVQHCPETLLENAVVRGGFRDGLPTLLDRTLVIENTNYGFLLMTEPQALWDLEWGRGA
jgi:hypothetical protein